MQINFFNSQVHYYLLTLEKSTVSWVCPIQNQSPTIFLNFEYVANRKSVFFIVFIKIKSIYSMLLLKKLEKHLNEKSILPKREYLSCTNITYML